MFGIALEDKTISNSRIPQLIYMGVLLRENPSYSQIITTQVKQILSIKLCLLHNYDQAMAI